mmetsp:Transcript_28148/g.42941  ORF Transcript_28148/g.42941 Transcript_28148/m.42941 type:complete len:81 (-) Transcript_28148:22-264(-)
MLSVNHHHVWPESHDGFVEVLLLVGYGDAIELQFIQSARLIVFPLANSPEKGFQRSLGKVQEDRMSGRKARKDHKGQHQR